MGARARAGAARAGRGRGRRGAARRAGRRRRSPGVQPPRQPAGSRESPPGAEPTAATRCGPTASRAPARRSRRAPQAWIPARRSSRSSTARLAALVSRVPLAEFGEEPLREQPQRPRLARAGGARARGRARAVRSPTARSCRCASARSTRTRTASARCSSAEHDRLREALERLDGPRRSGASSCCSTPTRSPRRRASAAPRSPRLEEEAGGPQRGRRVHDRPPARAARGRADRVSSPPRWPRTSTRGSRTGPSDAVARTARRTASCPATRARCS